MSVRAVRLLLAGALVVGAVAQEVPTAREELELEVTATAADVGFGEGFRLTVVRSWETGFEPDDWDDDVLAPLTVVLVEASVREDGARVEETRQYRAYLFVSSDVTVPAPWFRARSADGETTRVAFADDLEFRVTSALGDGASGAIELPTDLLPAPFSWRRYGGLAVSLAVVLGTAWWFVRRRRLRGAGADAVSVEPAHVRALERLARLRDDDPQGREAVHAFFVAGSAVVRGYVETRFGLIASESTTEELMADEATARQIPDGPRARLGVLLAEGDVVKFARGEPQARARAAWLDMAEAFVRETSAAGGAAP